MDKQAKKKKQTNKSAKGKQVFFQLFKLSEIFLNFWMNFLLRYKTQQNSFEPVFGKRSR